MKLFSKEIDKKLFSQYSKGSDLDNQVVVTKIFNPYGNGRWFLLNSDPQDPDYLWAIVQMGDVVEMGSVLRSELESVRVSPFRFPLERDLSFRMVNAGELFRGLQEGKFYKKGGWVDGYAKGGIVYLESVGTYLRTSDMSTSPMEVFKNEGEINSVNENSDEWWDSLSQKDKKTIEEYNTKHSKKSMAKGGDTKDLDINSLVGKKLDDGKIIRVKDLGNDNIWIVRENFSGLVIEQGFTKDDIIKLLKGEKVEGLQMMAKGGELNLGIRKIAEQEGFTPKQLGKEYELVMAQAIVESLTDANFHNEARKLISLLENKPEWENKPEYGTKEYDKWEKSGVYNSKYWDADEKTRDFAIKVSQKSGYDGYAIASAFEYLVRIDGGYHKLADKIEKAMESNEEMADGGIVKKYAIVDENTDRIYIKNTNKEFIDLKFKELKEVYPNDKLSIVEFAHGGYMAKGGGIYTSDSLYYLQVIKDDKEVAREKFRAKSLKEAKEISEEEYESKYISKYGNPLNFIVSEAMKDGGKLIGNQKKLDVNKNGKLDAEDFKMLRGKMAMGGKVKFADKVKEVKASLLKRKKVSPKVQKDYGKTYSPKEAEESAKRIIGAQVKKYEVKKKFKKGGKTIAQTPAPSKDRVYGSSKNKVGSASSQKSAMSIKLDEGIVKTLTNKAKEYNENHSSKVSTSTLKAVMRRGMGAYSTSHRPTISGGAPNSRQAWGFARVNKFLLKKGGTKVKKAYVQDDDLLK